MASRSTRPATSARAGTAATSTDPSPSLARAEEDATVLAALRGGELELVGRLVGSSNNAMVVVVRDPGRTRPSTPDAAVAGPARRVELGPGDLLAVWKPTRGERPLFDFPIGTLSRREVAAYLVSEALGWGIVPPTVLREGPFGEGMLQLWIEGDAEADVIAMLEAEDPRLRRVALFDAIVNNTDRKGGHLLPVPGGHLYAVDHGVTFSVVPKLRTLLWAWEGVPFDDEERAGLSRVAAGLRSGTLGPGLGELLARPEVEATERRVAGLLAAGVFPGPNPDWPAIPWPPF